MRDPSRIIPLTSRLIHAWAQVPDLRLCQLIEYAVPSEKSHFYMEDETLIRHIEAYVIENARPVDNRKVPTGSYHLYIWEDGIGSHVDATSSYITHNVACEDLDLYA